MGRKRFFIGFFYVLVSTILTEVRIFRETNERRVTGMEGLESAHPRDQDPPQTVRVLARAECDQRSMLRLRKIP